MVLIIVEGQTMSKNKMFKKELAFLKNRIGDVYASICFLYVQYCKSGTNKNDELVKIADQSLNQYLKLSNKNAREIRKEFDELNVDLANYSDIALRLIESESCGPNNGLISNRYLCELVDKLLDVRPNDIVFDLGSGYGNFLAFVSKLESNRFIKPILIGQEINSRLADASKMLLEMSEANYSIDNIDPVSSNSCPSFTKGYVFPPLGLKYEANLYDSLILENPNLFTGRVSSAWLFIFRALSKMKPNGKLVAIVNESCLFQSADANIRKYLIDNGILEGVISLPSNSFSGIGVKTDILVLSNGNKSFKIVDGTEVLNGLPIKGVNSHEAAVDLYNAYSGTYAHVFTKEDICTLDFCLTLNSFITKDIYQGISDLTDLTNVTQILKGCSSTILDFESGITESHTGTKILTSGDIDENGFIDFSSLKNVIEDKKMKKYCAQDGDIILSSKSTKVKIAVFNNDCDDQVIVTGGMIILRPKTKEIDSTFLKIFFDSKKGKELLNSIKKGIVITTISIANLSTLKIPCPNINLQKQIAAEYLKTVNEYQAKKKELQVIKDQLNDFYDKCKR